MIATVYLDSNLQQHCAVFPAIAQHSCIRQYGATR